jgi:AraC family transcriptional regulator of adaptative response/methylated-DNA-[protein]-cysteine methyltransferase
MSKSLTFEEQYQAIVRKDVTYEGVFYTAVKTTGIFCRPTCTARKPKPENVEFFPLAKTAILHGYRPCKRCKPLEEPGATPDYIQALLQELREDPELKLRDTDLRARDIEPSQIRRWFNKEHGMTFQAYQRMMRLNSAYHHITNGHSVTDAAFGNGYESLSGFNERFKQIFQGNPSDQNGKQVIHIDRIVTPLGPMYACATAAGICLLEFTDRRMLETEFKDLRKRLDAVILPGTNAHLQQLRTELSAYFAGTLQQFSVALHTPTTPFRQQVWHELQTIPYGTTRSYKEQAIRIGKPKAVRAVASANGHNRVAIVIPCHRVIGSDGSLTGYAGGLARKQWLLDLEMGKV